jgi:hypothetical protein
MQHEPKNKIGALRAFFRCGNMDNSKGKFIPRSTHTAFEVIHIPTSMTIAIIEYD